MKDENRGGGAPPDLRKEEGGRMKDENGGKGGGAPPDLKARTKAFALRIIRLYGALPKTTEAQVIGKQVLRSGTSVGAHYREATRARSNVEFISKVEAGSMELEESAYWLELPADAQIVPIDRLASLQDEVGQSTAILVTCIKNAKKRQKDEPGTMK